MSSFHLSKFDINLSAVQLSYHCKISKRKNSKVEFIIVIFKDDRTKNKYDAFSSFMFPTFITLPLWDPLQTVQVCLFCWICESLSSHNLLSFYAVPRALHHHPSHGNDAQQNRSCKLCQMFLKGESPSHHLSLAHVKEVFTSMGSVKRVRCWAPLLCLLRGICLSYSKYPTFAQTGDATGVSKDINTLLHASEYGTHLHFYL